MKNTNESRNAFAAQLRAFEAAERSAAQNPNAYGRELDSTAKMIALCVLKKLAMTAGHVEIMNALRRDIMSGDGDGVDLKQAAALAILEQTAAAHGRHGDTLPENWMEMRYSVRELDKRILIKSDDSAAWKDDETCAATEIFRAVRAEVEKSRGIQLASLKYCYIDDLATDDETGIEEAIYRRLPKYSTAIDESGESKTETVKEIDEIVTALNLTEKQLQVLNLRLQGYGIHAIASAKGVSWQAAAKTLKQIQAKALAFGRIDKSSALYFAIAEVETGSTVRTIPPISQHDCYADVVKWDDETETTYRESK